MPKADDVQTERLDESGLADARHAGNADADAAAGMRQKIRQQGLGGFAVVGAGRLDQRNGAGEAAAFTGEHGLGQGMRMMAQWNVR